MLPSWILSWYVIRVSYFLYAPTKGHWLVPLAAKVAYAWNTVVPLMRWTLPSCVYSQEWDGWRKYGRSCWFRLGHDCVDWHLHQPYTNDLSQPPPSRWLLFILGMRGAVFYQVENHTDLRMLSRNVETQGGSPQQWMQVGNMESQKR